MVLAKVWAMGQASAPARVSLFHNPSNHTKSHSFLGESMSDKKSTRSRIRVLYLRSRASDRSSVSLQQPILAVRLPFPRFRLIQSMQKVSSPYVTSHVLKHGTAVGDGVGSGVG